MDKKVKNVTWIVDEKLLSTVFIIDIKLCYDPGIVISEALSVFVLVALRKMELLYTACPPIQYHSVRVSFIRDPGKGKVITDSVIVTTPIAFIFTGYCLFSMLYRFM